MSTDVEIFTIGVYGKNDREFLEQLRDAKIDLFCDIRQRRGLRGSLYTFANSKRLQALLKAEGIGYIHVPQLAPSTQTRAAQEHADLVAGVAKRDRSELGDQFVSLYRQQLKAFNFDTFLESVSGASRRIAFFCVEANHRACHRSLVADEIAARYGIDPVHL
jgi:uncharacterized protein (DUF488 family)